MPVAAQRRASPAGEQYESARGARAIPSIGRLVHATLASDAVKPDAAVPPRPHLDATGCGDHPRESVRDRPGEGISVSADAASHTPSTSIMAMTAGRDGG